MNKKRIEIGIFVLCAFLGCLAAFVSCARKSKEPTFSIGVLAPLTGDVADYGTRGKNGAQMAADEVNASGGIKGDKIRLIIQDDKGTAKDAVAAMQKVVNVDKVSVVIGGMMSSVGLAIAPIAEQNKVILMAPGSSNPAYRNAGDFCFRDWTSDDFDGKVMAGYVYRTLGVRKAAILALQNDYCVGLADAFKKTFMAEGGEVVFQDTEAPGTTQFQDVLTKMKASHPDAVYLSIQPKEGGLIVKQMAELAIHIKIGSNLSVETSDFLTTAGAAAEDVFFTTPAFNPESTDPEVAQFVKGYKQIYGSEPDANAGHFYDALKIIAYAANRAKDLSSGSIRDELYRIKDFPGVTGVMTFDDHGDVTKPLMIKVVKHGKPELVQIYKEGQ